MTFKQTGMKPQQPMLCGRSVLHVMDQFRMSGRGIDYPAGRRT